MAVVDLLTIEPHKVSRDLSGYITYIYGPGGAGKTTFGANAEKPLLLAFEKGFNAIGGVRPALVQTWGEMKQYLRQMRNPAVKDMYKTVVVDTVDKAAALCEKYVCNQLEIENIGDGGWSKNGWAKVKKEWENTFNELTMEGYAVIFISHDKEKTIKNKDGSEYHQIVPSCSTAYNEIIRNMSDIEGYIDMRDGDRRLVLRAPNNEIECKSRFAKIAPNIPFGYTELVDALHQAIEDEGVESDNAYVTDDRETSVETVSYDYDALGKEFGELVGILMNANQTYYAPRITAVVEKYLGKGKKVADASIEQAEFIHLINEEIKDELVSKMNK